MVVLKWWAKATSCYCKSIVSFTIHFILDEATSAMDIETQRLLINNLHEYAQINKCTIVMIAHRFDSLRLCDRIVHLRDGAVVNVNIPYDELIKPSFQL